jgi:hypothetical protein
MNTMKMNAEHNGFIHALKDSSRRITYSVVGHAPRQPESMTGRGKGPWRLAVRHFPGQASLLRSSPIFKTALSRKPTLRCMLVNVARRVHMNPIFRTSGSSRHHR